MQINLIQKENRNILSQSDLSDMSMLDLQAIKLQITLELNMRNNRIKKILRDGK